MKTLSQVVLGTLFATSFATAGLAEKSDRAFVEQMRYQINAARSEPGVAQHGATELAEAERRLPELARAMDDNEVEDARAARDGINALIDAARVQARMANERPESRPASYAPRPAAPAKSIVHRVAYKRPHAGNGCTLASR